MKLILSDDFSSLIVNIEGKRAPEILNLIEDGVHMVFRNLPVEENSNTN